MTDPKPELDALLAPLRDGPVSLGATDGERARKARLLPGMRSAVRALPRVRARQRLVRRVRIGSLAVVALAASFGLASWRFETRAPTVASSQLRVQVAAHGEQPVLWRADGAEERSIRGADELHGAGELRARDGASASLRSALGVELEVASRSRVRVLAAERGSETFSLLEGELHCRVPPLQKGQSFVVATPSSRVVVHGTDFRVRVGGPYGSCVSVREGLVEVQREGASVWLGPGNDWGCETHERSAEDTLLSPVFIEPRPEEARPVRARRDKPELSERPQAARSLEAAAEEPGTLALETSLLADALRAEQEGKPAQARALFARLIAEYPSSPLAPEAKAGLARLR